ncbi:uncharacterized protein LOC107265369 isoform X2 [Cephus cinctus]|uniref:Uncharacterized protein LOC107265369 isoform X2 n=1 Tax=Cephus cinctus TaxID=211228 RepID=A0AAJ7VYX5_CEPCN|nr:uncharacterized protein LOC107265369 isoform X2 [Cephus cinctus]
MWRLRFTKLLVVFLVTGTLAALAQGEGEYTGLPSGNVFDALASNDEVRGSRIQRDLDGESQDVQLGSEIDATSERTLNSEDPPGSDYEKDQGQPEENSRKRIRIRVPVVRSRNGKQHKFTVVRRRPLVPYTKNLPGKFQEIAQHTPRRLVVTRVKSRGPVGPVGSGEFSGLVNAHAALGARHKVTVTRRRKIRPTSVQEFPNKARVTRKKLVNVRPIVQPTPTVEIITTGFFSAPSLDTDNNDSDEYELEDDADEEKIHGDSLSTPNLEDTPNSIENKPEDALEDSEEPSKFELALPEVTSSNNDPVIITDNFFFPPSNDDEEVYDDDYLDHEENPVETTEYQREMNISIDLTKSSGDSVKDDKDETASDDNLKYDTDLSSTTENLLNVVLTTEQVIKDLDDFSTTVSNPVTTNVTDDSNSTTIRTDEMSLEKETIPITVTTDIFSKNDSDVKEIKDSDSSIESVETITINAPTDSTITESNVGTDNTMITTTENLEEELTVKPLESELPIEISEKSEKPELSKVFNENSNSSKISLENRTVNLSNASVLISEDSIAPTVVPSLLAETTTPIQESIEIPTVIPLESSFDKKSEKPEILASKTIQPIAQLTTTITSPTPEDIEAGLADDFYLSLSRPDFPKILPSKPIEETRFFKNSQNPPDVTPELSTRVYYSETVVTSTRLRTYTYVVTKLNGLMTEVTSSTTVKPRVTTLTLTVPVTITVTPKMEPSPNTVSPVYNPEPAIEVHTAEEEDEGRRFNLATRIMSNGVEVIVAGPTPALRWENSNPQPTLTLSDAVMMLLPQDNPHEFVTKTCTTVFTYLNTITKDGKTIISTDQQVVANTATEERHRKPVSETAGVTLEGSPTLRTEVFKTTYTYLTLNTDYPDVDNALESSVRVIANTMTAPQHYLDMILEPSEAPRPETNTYLSTRLLEKTFMEDGRTKIKPINDVITQLIITESVPPPKPTRVAMTLTALDNIEEKLPSKKSTTKIVPVFPTPEPIQIFATKTYLTTFTYFTTLLQAGPDGDTLTTVSSRSHIVENVVTESIAPNLLDPGYMNALLTTAHHSDTVKNVVTGSTIIFFDEEDQIDPTLSTKGHEATLSIEPEKVDKKPEATVVSSTDKTPLVMNAATVQNAQTNLMNQGGNNTKETDDSNPVKKPSNSQSSSDLQVSNLLSLGSLGINGLSALGPVITAMAGLLQGKTSATRRNDSITPNEPQEVTTQRSPIYIPVAEFADGDIDTAESQNIGTHLANLNHNYLPETRHKVAASLADGIPISPGEVITANSDVIIGKPGKLAPRPPHTFLKGEENIGMKPPPMPVPNIPVHPVHEVIQDHEDSQAQQTTQGSNGHQIQILPAHQIYEEHLKVPASLPVSSNSNIQLVPKHPQKLHLIQSHHPKRAGSKHDIMQNDPLLKPPSRPNVEQYANPNVNTHEPNWSPEKYRRPWSAKDPLNLPQDWRENEANDPSRFDDVQSDHLAKINRWPKPEVSQDQKRPPWAQKDPLLPDTTVVIENSESKPKLPEPIIHQVPHVIDRPTGQPLLVNIQPSQVANVVIPQGGTQALIFGDTSEPHITGQYFDDPSPYPEPEVGPGFVGIEKVEDLPQFSTGNDPADYMVPPSPPSNFKQLPPKSSANQPHTIPLSHSQSPFVRPQTKSEVPLLRPERPEVHFIQRPEGPGMSSGQGHVHTEILVHHRPETVNIRPQAAPHAPIQSHVNPAHQLPPRRDYPKPQRPSEPSPPRRTDVPIATEIPHQYIFLGKPTDSGNEVPLNSNWKSDKKPSRINPGSRPRPATRPRPPIRTNTNFHSHVLYPDRPAGHSGRKPQYPAIHRQPIKPQFNFTPPNWSQPNPQKQEPSIQVPNLSYDTNVNIHESSSQYSQHSQIDLQNRPLHFYNNRPNMDSSGITVSQEEPPADYVPTGAVEYHNPSSDPKVKPEDTQYYPQVSTIKPEVQSFGEILQQPEKDPAVWQINTQTEKVLEDSESSGSENVKVHDHPQDQDGKNKDQIHKYDKDDIITVGEFNQSDNNVTVQMKNPYDTVGSVNTVVGKPLDIEQGITYGQKDQAPVDVNQSVQFGHQNGEGSVIQGVPFMHDYYTIRPYETPIVQGKPFGVYNGYSNIARPYGHNQKGSRPDYEIVQGVPFGYQAGQKPTVVHQNNQMGHVSTQKPYERDDTIDLKPPAIISQYSPESGRPSRPYSRPQNRPDSRPTVYWRPEIITKPPNKFDIRPDHVPGRLDLSVNRPGHVEARPRPDSELIFRPDFSSEHTNESYDSKNQDHSRNQTILHANHGSISQADTASKPEEESRFPTRIDQGTQIHPEYPHILTKPRPQIPVPITISSGPTKTDNNGRPKIQFSLPVEATGDEEDSKTQTERPPSMLVTKNIQNNKQNDETLETAYQTNFATSDVEDDLTDDEEEAPQSHSGKDREQESGMKIHQAKLPSQDMMPPPLRAQVNVNSQHKNEATEEGLKPPPLPSDVLGLSPPPVTITTTNRPIDDDFPFVEENQSGLRPPPKYDPSKDSNGIGTPPSPDVSMVPPSPRPTMARPFLVELLSEDMVPPPPILETSRPLEVATVRPAVAVSGSIQIATAVATSHIPVIQDMESKIPIIHGTVDLPVVVDVPAILRPVETKMTEHVSIYTVKPFESRPVSRVSVQPTAILTTNLIMPTKLRPPLIDQIEPSRSLTTPAMIQPTRSVTAEILNKPSKRPDRPVFLEASKENIAPSRIEPTESLTYIVGTDQNKKHQSTKMDKEDVTNIQEVQMTNSLRNITKNNDRDIPNVVTRIDSSVRKVTNTLVPKQDHPHVNDTMIKVTKDIVGTVIHEVVKDGSTATMEMKPKEVTRYKTLTVTRTETSVLGSPPTTRTLLLTHTITSTIVETVTETLLRPTSVVATVTSTVLHSVTRIPSSYENVVDNDSIFVVMSDQNPPEPGAEEVEAEYGEEEVSRDEQDPAGNEIHRVLAGGILGAPVIPLQPASNQCVPECRASKAEICAEVGAEMRCVCRPGFARMFPDRPCKPTYTYTVRVGLDRIGRDPVIYEPALNHSSSEVYRRLAGPTKEALDRTLMQSDLRDIYRGLNIAGFNGDPTAVEFHVQLSDNANETRLKDVLRKYLVGSNYSLGGTEVYAARDLDLIDARDFDECATEEGGPHHDCSQNAACFNLRGSYQCSCREGWADLSENPAYPGRVCSQAPLGCPACNYKGHCVTNTNGQQVCECFPWHNGQRCQVNLKVLLIALATTGAILLGLLAVCVGLACFRKPGGKTKSGDRRAMIPGPGGDTSSEGSVTDLAIPHHVPHVLPPPPQMVAPAPPIKKPVRKISAKPRHPPRKPAAPVPVSANDDQRDRSLTVMIPRAKYRSAPQSPQNYKPVMSTFAADEHKLISYLEGGSHPGNRKVSITSNKDYKEAELQIVRAPVAPGGALVSAGFQVSATVTRTLDVESTLARSCGETTVEPATKILRTSDLPLDHGSTLARSCGETTIQAPTKLLRLDLGEAGSTLARSCGETTVQPPTKVAANRRSSMKDVRDARDTRDSRDTRDTASDGHTMAERDLGSTLRLPAQHPPLYNPDRASDRESNFDSL